MERGLCEGFPLSARLLVLEAVRSVRPVRSRQPVREYSVEEYNLLLYGSRDGKGEPECTDCHGKRLNEAALRCKINGYSIAELCGMELTGLRKVLTQITDRTVDLLVQTIIEGLNRMIEIGLPYLHLNRETPSLSGSEVVFTGTPMEMPQNAKALTADSLRASVSNKA